MSKVQEVVGGLLGARTTVKEAVSNFLNEVHKRNSKIQEKINGLQGEATTVKSGIDELMRELVEFDLSDDAPGQASANKKLVQLRSKYDDLQARIAAYQGAIHDQYIIQSGIPKVLDLARKARDERFKALEKKKIQRDKLQQELDDIQKQLQFVDNEMSTLRNYSEARELRPLLKYIETRKFKLMSEEKYLSALISGETKESLERYIEQPREELEAVRNVTYVGPSSEEREAERQKEKEEALRRFNTEPLSRSVNGVQLKS